jgi:hypothetical protein
MVRSFLRYTWLLLLLGWLPACDQAGLTGSDILFEEQFIPTQLTNWLLEGDSLGRSLILNEQLVIQIDAPNTMQYVTLAEPTFSDFVLELDARLLSGPEESSYGILFRQDEDGRFYRFQITGTGLYILERRNGDGSWTRLTDGWTESEAIYQGANIVNRLRVEAVGPRLAIYANGELLHEASDNAYSAGTIALDAGTFGRSGVQVAFDNLVVRQP